jgi:hypothetical protein
MKTLLNTNVSAAEQISRYAVGAALIALVMANPAVPVWVALLACYPIFTAMVRRDPLNAGIQLAINKVRSKGTSHYRGNKTVAQW